MNAEQFAALIAFLELLLPQLMVERVDGLGIIKCRVGDFDNLTLKWATQLRFPEKIRKRLMYERSGEVFVPATLLVGEEVFGKGLRGLLLNATTGLREGCQDNRYRPTEELEPWLQRCCSVADNLGLERLYLVYFKDERLGTGYAFCTRVLKSPPTQYPKPGRVVLYQAGLMVAGADEQGQQIFNLSHSGPRKRHTDALRDAFIAAGIDPGKGTYRYQLFTDIQDTLTGISCYDHH